MNKTPNPPNLSDKTTDSSADTISGFVEHIIFISPENGFTVAKLKEKGKKALTCIVGTLPSIQSGETLVCTGNWKKHLQFGVQFQVEDYSVSYPADLMGIQKYLESGLIKGIGPVYAQKIIDKFGLDTLDVIDMSPDRLLEVPGIGAKKLEKMKTCWDSQKEIRTIIIFLRTNGLSPSYAQKIYKIYGRNTLKKVEENPYQLAKDIQGIGFKTADLIASKLGFDKTSALRLESGIAFVLWEMMKNGHTCYRETEFLPLAEKMLEVEVEIIEQSLKTLIEKKEIVKTNLNGVAFLFLKPMDFFEEGIAKELFRLKNSVAALRDVDAKKALIWAEETFHIKFAMEQKEGISKGVSEKVHIITGGPGTGKSTITRAILEISSKLTNRIVLAAPTGRAAKRLTQITRKKAFTIHSLLEFDFAKKEFKKNPENQLSAKLLIIDEASMIDTMLMYYLLRAIPSNTRVIFIGDIDQLPSVGPGYILKDLIASDAFSVTRLKTIFRQAAGSDIILNAHKINAGVFPHATEHPKSDFLFFEEKEAAKIKDKIIQLVQTDLPKKYYFDPIEDIQVMCPMKRGPIGSENLNLELQNALNPSAIPLWRFGQRFHVNDKVMQLKNNYDKNVFNGDIGFIQQIDLAEQQIVISYDGRLVSYDFTEMDEIMLSYAVSVHKYQGSECPCVVMPVHLSHFKLLYRNLLYTAVTRGKKLVVLVGAKQAIAVAVKNNEVLKRYTGLKEKILEAQKNEDLSLF